MVKLKISGQFKEEHAAQNFANIRSFIDTTIKNGLNILVALAVIVKFDFQTSFILRTVNSKTKLVEISIDIEITYPRICGSYPRLYLMDHGVQRFEI